MLRIKISNIACLMVCCALLLPADVDASPIKINPGRFQGAWRVGTSKVMTGPATLDLLPGQKYHLNIEQAGNVPFTVLLDGSVKSNRPESAIGAGKTLTLKTMPVIIHPGIFLVPWHLPSISRPTAGPASLSLVPGLTYGLSFGPMEGIRFTLLSNGTIKNHTRESANVVGNALTFKTTPVIIQPGRFSASWYVSDVSNPHRGAGSLDLMPGLNYSLSISNVGKFNFSVSGNGAIKSLNPESALGSGKTLTFKTTSVSINPGHFLGAWKVLHISNPHFGTGRVDLIPGLTYSLSINGTNQFQFDVKDDGTIHSRHPESARGSGKILIFKTASVKIDTGGSSKNWVVTGVPSGLKSDTVDLIPGFTYTLLSEGIRGKFMLRGPCSVAPSNLVLDKSIFHFRCTESLNKPPVADSGPDQNIPLEKTVSLDGSDSFDPDGDPIMSYHWSIDSAPVGSEESLKDGTLAKLKFVPDKAGEYLFSLKVSDGKMMSKVDTMRLSVVINQPPIGKASVSPSSGLAPLKVFFDASPSSDPEGGRLDHAWNFGDPSSGVENRSNLGIFSHVYRNSGYYTAILTVTDKHGKKSITTFEIQVKGVDLPPSVTPGNLPVSSENPLSVQFLANASDPEEAKLSYRWDFGDGSAISTDMEPVHQYAAGGSFEIVLTVSDGIHEIKRGFSLSLRKKTTREKFSYDFFKK